MENGNWLSSLLFNPFTAGLVIGLIVAAVVWARGVLKTRSLNASLKKLREHLHTKLEIDSEENERRTCFNSAAHDFFHHVEGGYFDAVKIRALFAH